MELELNVPLIDQEEQREARELEAALAAVAVGDSRFVRWWEIYRNHHKGPVILLPHRQEGEGTYLWHFHVTRRLSEPEKHELLLAMRTVVREALDARGVEMRTEVPPADDLDIAVGAVVFPVPVPHEEQARRIESRRARGEVINRWYQLHSRALDAAEHALATGQPLPTCPLCSTRIGMVVTEHSDEQGRTMQRALLKCATPRCFSASVPLRSQTPDAL